MLKIKGVLDFLVRLFFTLYVFLFTWIFKDSFVPIKLFILSILNLFISFRIVFFYKKLKIPIYFFILWLFCFLFTHYIWQYNLLFFLNFFFITLVFSSDRDRILIKNTLNLLVWLEILASFVIYYFYGSTVGTIGNPNYLSYFILFSLIINFEKFKFYQLLLIALYFFVFTKTRGAFIISIVLTILKTFNEKDKFKLLMLVIAIFLFIFFNFSTALDKGSESFKERLFIYKISWKVFKENWKRGVANFHDAFVEEEQKLDDKFLGKYIRTDWAHNIVMQGLAEMGLIKFLIVFLLTLYLYFRLQFKDKIKLLLFFFIAMFSFPEKMIVTSTVLYLMFSEIYRKNKLPFINLRRKIFVLLVILLFNIVLILQSSIYLIGSYYYRKAEIFGNLHYYYLAWKLKKDSFIAFLGAMQALKQGRKDWFLVFKNSAKVFKDYSKAERYLFATSAFFVQF